MAHGGEQGQAGDALGKVEGERARLYTATREVLGAAFTARRDVPPGELKAANRQASLPAGQTASPTTKN